MNSQAEFKRGVFQPLTGETAAEIAQWEYDKPFDVYSFKDRPNGYLMNKSTWGTEQFCLVDKSEVLGQVSSQFAEGNLWVGWSLAPALCGKGNGAAFVKRCVEEIRSVTGHTGRILLKTAAWNIRSIKAYQRAGFVYVETVQDEIAYTDCVEDFWVMEMSGD